MQNMKLCQNNKGLLINTITINKIDANNAIEALRATPIVFVGMAIMSSWNTQSKENIGNI